MPPLTEQFVAALRSVGGRAVTVTSAAAAADYLAEHLDGALLLPTSPSLQRVDLPRALMAAGVTLLDVDFRSRGATARGGLTGANFAIAATGTVVLESTDEDVRLASTLPEQHFVILDPRKIVADSRAAAPTLRAFHEGSPRCYLAWITGPSRTADIERVLTIGVHGPRDLHVLLWEGLSDDPLER
ncbi:MAG: lactate utilization protein [Desulfuromonadales bacterium]|nr:lactate utilization protein [Desulfuromonadales bacterium]